MPKRISADEYFERASKIHSAKYDYSKAVYSGMRNKLVIVCPIHGEFEQQAQAHLKGQGCPICGRERQKQTMISRYGVDNPMKSAVFFDKARATSIERYGSEWARSAGVGLDKQRGTNILRYGVEYPLQSDSIRKKTERTNLRRYGVKNVSQNSDVRERFHQTCMERHGYEEPLSAPSVRRKIVETNSQLYGGAAPMSSPDVREKAERTLLKNYGVKRTAHSFEILEKIRMAKAINGTFNTSGPEELLYHLLCDFFGTNDVCRQYYSSDYPFSCDFYVRSRDLYIECNASWTHGNCWFNNSKHDKEVVDLWSARDTDYYRNALRVWTEVDVKKRNQARKVDLNYVVFWDTKLRDAVVWFSMGCPDGKDWKKEYSWLPKRDITEHVEVRSLPSTAAGFIKAVKSYQFLEFYKNEIKLWQQNKVYRNLLLHMWLYHNRLRYLSKSPNELTNLELLRGFTISGIQKGYSVFDVSLMAHVCQKYGIRSIYDPCAGWGERMLYCFKNGIVYHGVDINVSLRQGYDEMIKAFGIQNVSIEFLDSSLYEPTFDTDAVITCPPYGDTEIYTEFGAENLDEHGFLQWWKCVVLNSMQTSAEYFCFQVNQKWKNKMVSVVESCGFVFVEELHYNKIKSNHFNRKHGQNVKKEFESMVILKRI